MSTFTIRVTSSAINVGGTSYGQQPDLGAPSFWDVVVTGSTDPLLPNGRYDAYCLDITLPIKVDPTAYNAVALDGQPVASYNQIGLSSLTQVQVDQINWLLSQNFTSDTKYGGQYNFGEVQVAIWKIVGFTDAQIGNPNDSRLVTDNFRNVVDSGDINFLVSSSQAAVASGQGVKPVDTF